MKRKFFALMKYCFAWINYWWNCKFLGIHEWTCAVSKGIEPTKEQLSSKAGFWDYAKIYCNRCGVVSHLSKQMICKYKNSDLK